MHLKSSLIIFTETSCSKLYTVFAWSSEHNIFVRSKLISINHFYWVGQQTKTYIHVPLISVISVAGWEFHMDTVWQCQLSEMEEDPSQWGGPLWWRWLVLLHELWPWIQQVTTACLNIFNSMVNHIYLSKTNSGQVPFLASVLSHC